jgi:peptide/nickel transport system permease protein
MSLLILRRLLMVAPVVLTAVTINFILIHTAPGDPAVMVAGPEAPPEYVAEVRERLGLTRPVWDQYVSYIGDVLRADFGRSYKLGRPVAAIISDRIPATILLTATAFVVSVLLGVGLGILAGSGRPSAIHQAVETVAMILYSVPTFFVGLVLILFFGVTLRVLPVQGIRTVTASYTGWEALVDLVRHLALPATTLAVVHVAEYLRFSRASLVEVMDKAYIRTARAKGLGERLVIRRHALRNALIPIVTTLGLRIGFLLTGAAVTEIVFGWPGIGLLMYDSIFARDFPVILGVFVVTALMVSLANLAVDIAYAMIDPRIRYR